MKNNTFEQFLRDNGFLEPKEDMNMSFPITSTISLYNSYKPEQFTIEQIRNYLKSKDSLGDIFYFLSADAIIKANENVEGAEN